LVKTFSPSGNAAPALHIHKKLIGFALNMQGFLTVIAILSFLTAVVVVFQMYLLSTIVAQVFIHKLLPSQELFFKLLGCFAVRSCLIWLREWYAHTRAIEIKSCIRKNLIQSILSKAGNPPKHGKTGEWVALITDGAEKLDEYYVKYIPSVVHLAVFPVVILIFALWYDWLSGLVLLVTGPVILLFMWLIGTHAKVQTQKQWESLSRLSGFFLDVIQGIKTLKIHTAEKRENAKVFEESDRFRLLTMKILKVAFLSGFVLELAASISVAMLALQISIRMIEGLMVFQSGLFMLFLAPEYFLPFRQLGANHHSAMEGTATASKIFEFEQRSFTKQILPATFIENLTPVKIDFVNVSFNYPEANFPALSNISCTLLPGTITALVGRTGAGKTTFANLLLKHESCTLGSIFANGVSLDDISPELWHSQIAYVSQKPHFFNATILDNLLMANKVAGLDKAIEAAQLAGLHETILGFPDGYQTMITENASILSAGERQRLALARAFVKDAPLLILDEPTSNLDPTSEQWISQSTRTLAKGRTTLIIAHRLKTVVMADNILILENGTVVEQGTHSQLLNLNGRYAKMAAAAKNSNKND